MFSAVAGILMYFEFPLPFVPAFYKIDLSEVPILICSFMLGPVAGVAAEFTKIIIKLIIKPTTTAFVGELANFIIGCSFVIPAAIIYRRKKSKKSALIAMGIGIISMTVIGAFMNAFVLLPAFAVLYGGMPVSELIGMGTAVNSSITNMFTFIILAVVPLNLIKGLLTAVVTFLIYKRIGKLMKL